MNLIEQLGGYRKAKEWLDANEHEVKHGYLKDYRRELLQYRRENNIFEKGDWIKANDSQFGFNEIFKIDDFFADDDGINLAVLDDGDCYPLSWLTHATSKEIAQGYRDE